MPKLFISYSRCDSEFVSTLVNDLTELGFDVLLDRKHLRGGRPTEREIQSKIGHADFVLPVMTGDSARSEWVRPVELSWAFALQKQGRQVRILPLLLKESRSRFTELDGINYIDFTENYAVGLARLVQTLPHAEYDELFNLQKELENRKIEERSLLSILVRVATRPRKRRSPNWPTMSTRKFIRELRRVIRDDDSVDAAYWWLIVYGVLRFNNIEKFWDGDDTYLNSADYAELAPRGIQLMTNLALNKASGESRVRPSSRAAHRSRRRARPKYS